MSSRATEARLVLGDAESHDLELAAGTVSVRTLRCPDRSGPNEDAAVVIEVDGDSLVLAVADGVGGSPAGCEASTEIVETLSRGLASMAPETSLREAIIESVEQANTAILHSGTRSASTVVVAEISAGQLRCYHVGDSELFVVGQRGRRKHSLIPHSPTGFAVEAGLLDEAEAIWHDQRHIIFNVVGAPGMRVDISTAIDLAPLDTVLLCSDGVTDNLYVEEILNLIRVGPLAQVADRLMAAVSARMHSRVAAEPCKPDDVTIALYRRRRETRERSA
jgi:serine/threonine protein phosphatase PrpC